MNHIEILKNKLAAKIEQTENEQITIWQNRYNVHKAAWLKACDERELQAAKFYFDSMAKIEANLLTLISLPKNIFA